MKLVKALLVTAALLFSSFSQAALITDIVEQDAYVGILGSYSYTHNLLEPGDDPFALGSAISGDISIEIYDNTCPSGLAGIGCNIGELLPEIVLIIIEDFDFDSGGLSILSFAADLEVNALLALNSDGMLDVKVQSLAGNFFVGDSTLNIVTAAVPEPSIIALFGLGLLGLGFARRKTRS